MCMHERHVRECCLWLITSRTSTFQLPINKANPAGFQRLCCGDSGSPVPLVSSCTSPWPLGGLSSDPPILWDDVKVEGELIGQPWLLNDTAGDLVTLALVCVGSVKTPHTIPLCPSDSTFPRTFSVSSYNNGQLCSSEEGWGVFSTQRLATLLSHMALHMLTYLHLLAGN